MGAEVMRRLLLVLWFLSVALPCRAAIGFDNSASNVSALAVSSVTWSFTVGAGGTNRLLFVGVAFSDATITVSSVTYAGTGMTQIRTDQAVSPSNARETIFYLINPATGANNIVVTLSGTLPAGAGIVSGAISLTGAAQSGQPDANNGTSGGPSVTATVTVTTVADNCWVLEATSTGAGEVTWTSAETQRWTAGEGAGNSPSSNGASIGPVTPAGAQAMTETLSVSRRWAISAASFKPAAGAVPGCKNGLLLLGAGC